MLTRALAFNGARRIYIVGRRASILTQAAASIDPEIVIPVPGDVTSQSSLLDVAARVEKEVGFVNLVIANAGIMGPRPLPTSSTSIAAYRAHALSTPIEDFTHIYATNTSSVYYTALAFLDLLHKGNEHSAGVQSQVLATSSIGGFSRLSGASFAYSSSKAAVTHMCKMMSTAWGVYGVRCNVLGMGLVETELARGVIGGLGGGEDGRVIAREVIPAQRTGNEEDVAGAVLYVAGRAGAYLNGCVVMVDGGRLGVLPSTY